MEQLRFTFPGLSPEQKEQLQNQFFKELEAIIEQSSESKKLWENEKGIQIFSNKLIMPSGAYKKLKGKLADSFISLLNKYGLLID